MAEQRDEWVVEGDDEGLYLINKALEGNDFWIPVYVADGDPEEQAEELARKLNAYDDLLAACEEFVRKVECGEARSVRSYAQMKAAIAKARGTRPTEGKVADANREANP